MNRRSLLGRRTVPSRTVPSPEGCSEGPPSPIPWSVEAVDHKPMNPRANLHLLRDCLALGKPVEHRQTANVRLEEAQGPSPERGLGDPGS